MDSQEKELYTSILIAVAIIAAILVFFIVSIIRQQKRYRLLTQAKIRAEITTLENERKRIASDLHDEVGPLLSAVKLQINHLEGNTPEELDLIFKSSQYLDDIIRKMREISNDLLPNVLVRKGMVYAIKEFIGKVQSATSTRIEFTHGEPQRIPQVMEINIYRIVLEVIHNTIKHAEARQMRIQLLVRDGMVRLATEDDGKGFNYAETVRTKGGLGLLNLQSRTEVMGGEFTFESEKGKGTRFLFEIPIDTKL